MKMQQFVFLAGCFCVTAGLVWAYSIFWRHFESAPEQKMLEMARHQVEEEQLRNKLLNAQLFDFSQEVALRLPKGSRQELLAEGRGIADLASAVRAPASIPVDLSGVFLERGKEFFREKNLKASHEQFKQLLDRYPSSPRAVEAYFFLAETAYLQQDYKTCLETSDLMLKQFPDHELTGFILLRVGQISESTQKVSEALEIYQTVQKSFAHPKLKEQAKMLEKGLVAR